MTTPKAPLQDLRPLLRPAGSASRVIGLSPALRQGADDPLRVLVLYLGRRGGGARYALELTRGLCARPDLRLHAILSSQNTLLREFYMTEASVLSVPTYSDVLSFASASLRLDRVRTRLLAYLGEHKIDVVISAMSHLWMWTLARAVKDAGVGLISVIHDAVSHPGDISLFYRYRTARELEHVDRAVALTETVKYHLVDCYNYPAAQVRVIPHGAFALGELPVQRRFPVDRPFRFVFFGRILAYKGLDRLLRAYQILQAKHPYTELHIIGDGRLTAYQREQCQQTGVFLRNQWVSEDDLGTVVDEADAFVLPYVEASQSGVLPLAFAAGVPAVVTPVGGLVEQCRHGTTGAVARSIEPADIAAAMALLLDPETYVLQSLGALSHAQTELSWSRIAGAFSSAAREIGARRQAAP